MAFSLILGAVLAQSQADSLPEFSLRDVKGREWKQGALSPGRLYLFEFWATWCTSCRRMSPLLKELQKNHEKKSFEILAISVDEDMAALARRIKEDPPAGTVLLDPRLEAMRRFKVKSVPAFFLVRDGKILQRWTGPVDKARLFSTVDRELPR
jgi:thiol-disulfide isomerase/thioredoxin